MVGIFSRFSVGRNVHRRTQSALDEREVMPPNSEVAAAVASATTATSHGIEVAVEFKPVEHPIEPLDNDRPIQCPLPEPSILNCWEFFGLFSKKLFLIVDMHPCELSVSPQPTSMTNLVLLMHISMKDNRGDDWVSTNILAR
ncbi:uncharacterized protein LOC113869290 isoform X2 [Abrus precatorius]|uniref:Uncharacterized protein LOC113869290 isoform X2 n=1 Tax=Abrus precatorius TaxID=3816 RepID=A0A8B8LYK9_ABRPR|nr:uncharacterized protein LOC113869290 isoform X2 [Abrus precatorius]